MRGAFCVGRAVRRHARHLPRRRRLGLADQLGDRVGIKGLARRFDRRFAGFRLGRRLLSSSAFIFSRNLGDLSAFDLSGVGSSASRRLFGRIGGAGGSGAVFGSILVWAVDFGVVRRRGRRRRGGLALRRRRRRRGSAAGLGGGVGVGSWPGSSICLRTGGSASGGSAGGIGAVASIGLAAACRRRLGRLAVSLALHDFVELGLGDRVDRDRSRRRRRIWAPGEADEDRARAAPRAARPRR